MHDAWVSWLRGRSETREAWAHLQYQAGAGLPWARWSFPEEASAGLELEPPLRFIRAEGVACMELPGLAAAISAVHAIIAQAEAMGVRSERIVLGGFGQCVYVVNVHSQVYVCRECSQPSVFLPVSPTTGPCVKILKWAPRFASSLSAWFFCYSVCGGAPCGLWAHQPFARCAASGTSAPMIATLLPGRFGGTVLTRSASAGCAIFAYTV